MFVGVPKEIKNNEYRVGLVPSSVRELFHYGQEIIVETGAGSGIGISDTAYQVAGAHIVSSAEEVYAKADLIVKVKEPQPSEIPLIRKGQILFTFLHLSADRNLTKGLLNTGCTAIAYETVTSQSGTLPLLMPMSEVAGRMSIHVGAHCLEKEAGGSGILLGGVPGVLQGNVTVIGGGVVGLNAARTAIGLGASVTVIDKSPQRLADLDVHFGPALQTVYSTFEAIEQCIVNSDLVIGAVLLPGRAAPKLVTRHMIQQMRPGSVLVDVAIDQGGCFETSRPTTFSEPTYIEDDVVHYCVTNMPGAVARTSAFALNNATLPYVLQIASKGAEKAFLENPHLLDGLNIYKNTITYEAIAEGFGLPYKNPKSLLK